MVYILLDGRAGGHIPNATWIALRLLEGDQSIIEAVRTGEIGNIKLVNTLLEETELKAESI